MFGRMARILMALTALFWLVSCNPDFLNQVQLGSTEADGCRTEWSADGLTLTCYDLDDNVVWVERYTKDGNGRFATMRHFNANNTLLYSKAWGYDANGNTTMEAKFDASDALQYYTVSTYDASNQRTLEVVYDAASAVQSIETTEWTAGNKTKVQHFGPASGGSYPLEWAIVTTYTVANKPDLEKNYGAGGIMSGTVQHYWDGSDRETKREYNQNPSAPSASFHASLQASLLGGQSASSRALSLPAAPASPTVPTVTLTDATVNLVTYQLWFYDSFGTSWVELTAGNLLTKASRSDSRLPGSSAANPSKILTELSWDGAALPAKPLRKTTSFNNRVALDVQLGYNGTGWLNSIGLSGAAMYLPLTFNVSYKAPASVGGYVNIPDVVTVYSGGVKLYSFRYELVVAQLPAAAGKLYDFHNLQPSDFSAALDLTIKNYDGDDKYLGAYEFSVNAGNLRIASTKPDGSSNGYFELTQDGSGNNLSFVGYNAASAEVYRYDYRIPSVNEIQDFCQTIVPQIREQASAYNVDLNQIIQILASLDPQKVMEALY